MQALASLDTLRGQRLEKRWTYITDSQRGTEMVWRPETHSKDWHNPESTEPREVTEETSGLALIPGH